MRYVLTSPRTPGKVIVGYDSDGLLTEVQVLDMPEGNVRLWPFRNAPLQELEVQDMCDKAGLKCNTLEVTFDEFWNLYNYKESKMDAQRAWNRLSEVNKQAAFAYVKRYQSDCQRNGKHLQYPASYLNAQRWLDHK